MNEIKNLWKTSKPYRLVLVCTIIYTVFCLTAQVFLAMGPFLSAEVDPEKQISSDLRIYVNAAQQFQRHEDLYLKGSLKVLETHYPYSPAFALMFAPIFLLPFPVLVIVALVLHVAAYALLYIWWERIFRQNHLEKASKTLALMLPLFLVFSGFWDDLAYLNIYIIIALFATFLIDAILQEKLGWAIFWLGVVILPIKPHWAFAAVLPLLLGRYRFFIRLMIGTVLAYLAVMGITILVGGIPYGFQQYQDYIGFLARLSRDFPWRGPDKIFLGYNHSIVQVILFYWGVSNINMLIALVTKLLLLIPLGLVTVRCLRNPAKSMSLDTPQTALELAFAFYLGAFIWLDMVWEASLGIIVFVYLLAVVEEPWEKVLLWVVFFPYAIIDVWRLASYLSWGDKVFVGGFYVITDPLIYVPIIMIAILTFYALLVQRLWKTSIFRIYR